jgi:DNA-binding IclR family transcriptional regulator
VAPSATTREETAQERPRVQSAARAVGVLLAIASSDTGLAARDISEMVGISRQATYHLLHTLSGTGMVTRNERGRHVLGLRVGTLAEGFQRQLSPPEHIAPLVRQVATTTSETAYAAGWWAGEITSLHVVHGSNAVTALEVPRGYGGDAHARASGKLLLAFAPSAVREEYLSTHMLRRLTPNTIVRRKELDHELELIRQRGYAEDAEEFALGLHCLAVPLDGGRSPFVLGLSAPRERYERSHRDYLDAMRAVAASVSSAHA